MIDLIVAGGVAATAVLAVIYARVVVRVSAWHQTHPAAQCAHQDGWTGERVMHDLLQDGPGCSETRRLALWFASRMDAMWLARRWFYEAMTKEPRHD